MSESDSICDAKGIPRHLHQLSRTADPYFEDEEVLFRRYSANCIDLTSAISFERMSVNRSKYCKTADDTLWNDKDGGRYSNFGVIAISVKSLSFCEKHPDEEYHFGLTPEHKPEACNYAHTEVVATKILSTGVTEKLAEIRPKSVKLALRKALRDSITIVVRAKKVIA